jgi:hypothetical protein
MDLAWHVASWIAVVALTAGFLGLIVYAIVVRRAALARARELGHDVSSPGAPRAADVSSLSQRARDVAVLGLFALAAGLSWQVLLVPFYARNAIGHTVTADVAYVFDGGRRGGHAYTVVAHYKDRSGHAQRVEDSGASRSLYERCDTGGCTVKFVVVDGWPRLAQLGALPEVSPMTVVLGALLWIALLLALRDQAIARSLFHTAWRGNVSASAACIQAAGKRPDLRVMSTRPVPLGSAYAPRLLWWRDRWIGVLLAGERFGARLELQLAGWYPPLAAEPRSRFGPWELPSMVTWAFPRREVAGDGGRAAGRAFDDTFTVGTPHAAFADALLDVPGRALQERLFAEGAGTWWVGGRRAGFLIGRIETEAQVLRLFEAVELWLEHLGAYPSRLPPPGLCHLCGWCIHGAGERCARCGGHFHAHCVRSYGGCPLPSCMGPSGIADGLVRYTTLAAGWDPSAVSAPGPEYFSAP